MSTFFFFKEKLKYTGRRSLRVKDTSVLVLLSKERVYITRLLLLLELKRIHLRGVVGGKKSRPRTTWGSTDSFSLFPCSRFFSAFFPGRAGSRVPAIRRLLKTLALFPFKRRFRFSFSFFLSVSFRMRFCPLILFLI